ncbi:MAG: metal-dependent hydrolase [Acidobacteria bacterium]|nr:metal-dependent hydrolase [Acidobacteriota bacterium]
MDNLTHTLFAIALARAGGRRLGPYATGLLVLAANLPDIDVVSRLESTAAYLHYHRGPTHALAAAPLLALAVAGVFALGRRLARSTRPFSFARAYLVALGGVVVGNIFLDWCTGYGTRLLAPFSWRWLAWDAIPILDVVLLAVLAAAIALPHFFRLISDEIGADTWELADVNLLDTFDPTLTRTYYRPEPSPPLEAARQSYVGKAFMDFARFPFAYVEPDGEGFEVIMRDLRFEQGVSGRKGFVARIRLAPNLSVVSEVFDYRSPVPVR